MLDWIDHHAQAIGAISALGSWICVVSSHYRLKWLIDRVHKAVKGKFNSDGR